MSTVVRGQTVVLAALVVSVAAFSARATDKGSDADATPMSQYMQFRESEDWNKAASLVRDYMAEMEAKHGAQADETVVAYLLQTDYETAQGNLAEARKSRDAAIAILSQATRLSDQTKGFHFSLLATLSISLEDLTVAEAMAQKAMALFATEFPFGLIDIADKFVIISEEFELLKKPEDAERAIIEARRAIDLCPATYRIRCLDAMAGVATFYAERKRYREAAEFREAAARIVEQHDEGAATAALFFALASLDYTLMGDNANAEAVARRAAALVERAPDKDKDVAVKTITILANACTERGKWEEAEALAERSLRIAEAAHGTNSVEACFPRMSLIDLFWDQGRYREAEPLLRTSIAVLKPRVAVGEDTHFVSLMHCIKVLAALVAEEERFEEGDKLFSFAMKLLENRYGKNCEQSSDLLRNYAHTVFLRGQFEKAESLCVQSLDSLVDDDIISEESTARTLCFLGMTQLALGKVTEATKNVDRGAHKMVRHLRRNLSSLSSTEQLRILRKNYSFASTLPLTVGLALSHEPAVRELSATWLCNAKGLALEAMVADRAELQKDPASECWIDVAQVRTHIPRTSIYVDISRVEVLDYKPNSERRQNNALNARYVAWIIPSLGEYSIQVIDLGEASEIDKHIASYRDVLRASLGDKRQIFVAGGVEAEQALSDAAKSLAQKLLKPILAGVRDLGIGDAVNELIVSPDAELWLVPWSALPLSDNRYLVERYAITTVTSARDLLPAANPSQAVTGPMIFADPLFELPPETLTQAVKEIVAEDAQSAIPSGDGVGPASRAMRSASDMDRPERLPGALNEARRVAGGIQRLTQQRPVIFVQARALEERVKRIRSPCILHFATHGFALPDQVVPASQREIMPNDMPMGGRIQGLTSEEGKPLEDPLLRCGLLLTGCSLPAVNRPKDVEDGYLTGREIVGLDLRGTDLVVLSACDTGLGRVQYGEGVAGLRQAFLIAGAEAVLATLWSVPDGPTAELIAAFVDQLAEGKGKAEALRQAQLALIEKQRKQGGSAYPAAWAAFELTGR